MYVLYQYGPMAASEFLEGGLGWGLDFGHRRTEYLYPREESGGNGTRASASLEEPLSQRWVAGKKKKQCA
jgi:hypothetical protein